MLKRYGDKALEQSSARANELTADGDHDAAELGSRRPIYLKKARWHEYGRRLTPSASAQE
jgi:hypothetical protein